MNTKKFLKEFNALEGKGRIFEERRKLLHTVMNDCETYGDAERLAENGVITLENIMDLLTHFEETAGVNEEEVINLEKFVSLISSAPRAGRKTKRLL